MEETTKKQKVSRKAIAPFVERVVKATLNFKAIIDEMPDCSIKKAYTRSLDNLEKKNIQFSETKERISLSDDEKELLRKFRAGEITLEQNKEDSVQTDSFDMGEKKKAKRK